MRFLQCRIVIECISNFLSLPAAPLPDTRHTLGFPVIEPVYGMNPDRYFPAIKRLAVFRLNFPPDLRVGIDRYHPSTRS